MLPLENLYGSITRAFLEGSIVVNKKASLSTALLEKIKFDWPEAGFLAYSKALKFKLSLKHKLGRKKPSRLLEQSEMIPRKMQLMML